MALESTPRPKGGPLKDRFLEPEAGSSPTETVLALREDTADGIEEAGTGTDAAC